jgi:CheY-like chemotaxis protein
MSRILLVDDSPHAQRMGERILSEEGYEVVTVSNADSALIRLDDVDPDVVIADTVMPGRTGFEICQYLKMSPRHRHVRVVLTAGVLEALDEDQAKRVGGDGTLKKPFEATALLAAVKPLAEAAGADRAAAAGRAPASAASQTATPAAAPFVAVVDAEQVRAAVTVALDASMAAMVDEITRRVTAALAARKSGDVAAAMQAVPAAAPPAASPVAASSMAPRIATPPVGAPATASPIPASPIAKTSPLAPPAPSEPDAPAAIPPPTTTPRPDTIRRVSAVRARTGSILGLDIGRREGEEFLAPTPRPPAE